MYRINRSLPIHPTPSFLPWYPYIHLRPFSASASLFLLWKKVHQCLFSKFQKRYDSVFLFLTPFTLYDRLTLFATGLAAWPLSLCEEEGVVCFLLFGPFLLLALVFWHVQGEQREELQECEGLA